MDLSFPRTLASALVFLLLSLHHSICCHGRLNSTAALGLQWQTDALQANLTVLANGNFSLILGTASPRGPCTLTVQHVPSALQVWVANFYNASSSTSTSSSPNCSLALQKDGDLQLRESGNLAWNSGTAANGVKSIQLLGSGNLVLVNGTNSNVSKETVWQSFDHPSDTLITGQRLNLHITMFAAAADAPYNSGGVYSMAVSNISNDLLLYAYFNQPSGPEIYWSMEETFSVPQNAWVCCLGSYVEVSNGLTVYDSSSQSIVSTSSNNLNPNSEFFEYARLESDGNLRNFVFKGGIWQLNYQALTTACQHPDACGQYGICSASSSSCSSVCLPGFHLANASDPTQGCRTPALPLQNQCNSTAVTMFNATGYTYFSSQNFYNGESQANFSTLDDCKLSCLQNCSCQSAFFTNDSGSLVGSCYLMEYPIRTIQRSNDPNQLVFIKMRNVSSLLAPAPAPAPVTSPQQDNSTGVGGATASPISPNSDKKTLAIALSVGCVGTFIAVAGLVTCFIKKRQLSGQGSAEDEMYLDTLPGLPPRFSYKALHDATNGFANKLGAGGFGSVYEGLLAQPYCIKVAVKELKNIHNAGTKQFRAEVATLGSISHRNLVRLCGYCVEGSHRLLVYEFMENGSLERVFSHTDDVILDWHKRCAIALGTAQGLAYLHEECTSRIIHCDIKPENILLDKQWNAKVSDFGLAKLMNRDESYAVTTMRGTRGYLAPEWLKNLAITERSDVFSYGIVLLELVGGRRSFNASLKECYLPAWAFELVETGADLMELLDARLYKQIVEEKQEESVRRMVKVALWCVQEDPGTRPVMSWVVKMLEAVHGTEELASPPPCSFFAKAKTYFQEDEDDADAVPKPKGKGDAVLSHTAQSELSWQMSTLVSGR